MNKETFGRMVIKNEQQIYRIAKSILKNDEDCADAAQEAVAKALENLPSLKNDAYAKTWFIRILIRTAYDILRKQKSYVVGGEGGHKGRSRDGNQRAGPLCKRP